MKASELFDFPDSLPFGDCFGPDIPPWEWVDRIRLALAGFSFGAHAFAQTAKIPGLTIGSRVYIHPSVILPPYGVIEGPAYIAEETRLLPGIYIRQNVIAGRGCVLGHNGEYKNCLLLDGVVTPHRPYVGDSVLGNGAHLAAGVVLANLRFDQSAVAVQTPEGFCDTGMRKLGALIGDGAEVGCNAVLQPGTVLGRRALVAPSLTLGGYLDADTIACQSIVIKRLQRGNNRT